ncbi:histidine phosphatase family protein [Streptacidiphilus pinicola]|uniref:Histidine phosphatase family protein n=1 Tax=Streptacidiphilus pinicola TaxID=2219663 RepID=A0A2X0I5L9_9ACTN|nr:histidine phosphatase family protein [Streptacidiphilus pinicola]RAG80262.1 histidine phosphatase family protein [Streptacidiphilus pinicola]
MQDRYLCLVRHGQAMSEEGGLTGAGRRQAQWLGRRLRGVPLASVHHGPLPRAAQTARLVAGQLGGLPLCESEAAGDYVPYVPEREELPAETADALVARFASLTAGERARGAELARRAVADFTGPVVEGNAPRYDLVVTHAFLIAWLVRAAMGAPAWRWVGFNHANAALTVIRYAPGRAASVLVYNDMSHLPEALRWTGFPAELRAP